MPEALRRANNRGDTLRIVAPSEFDDWRAVVRRLLAAQVAPEQVVWSEEGDLLAQSVDPQSLRPLGASTPRVPRRFVELADKAFLHNDPARLGLLYRIVWRLQAQPELLADGADTDIRRLEDLARAVRRDIHKMRAFVRFRALCEPDGGERFVAWFEPQHDILRANAAFFVNRFAAMRWSILTPQGSLHWDGDVLLEGPPARREDAPGGDPTEELWRTYFASIFNPARLKVGAMVKEMPKRYWKNMPEAGLIPGLIAGAQAREARMVATGGDAFAAQPAPGSLAEVAEQIEICRRCPIGCNGTHAVAGEGPAKARLMIVGEQPGDQEEHAGRPFVGPAGQVLTAALERAGIDRGAAYVTNAVKHFKHTLRGKRRLHQNPTASEIDHCRWWLDREREIVRPQLVLTLGGSALRGLTGRTQSISQVRGQARDLADGSELWPTIHPSYLLRLDGEAKERESRRFASDLALVAERLRSLGVEGMKEA